MSNHQSLLRLLVSSAVAPGAARLSHRLPSARIARPMSEPKPVDTTAERLTRKALGVRTRSRGKLRQSTIDCQRLIMRLPLLDRDFQSLTPAAVGPMRECSSMSGEGGRMRRISRETKMLISRLLGDIPN